MAYPMKPTKPGVEESQEPTHKIRITLSSKDVKNLEKGITFIFLDLLFFCFRFLQFVLVFCSIMRAVLDFFNLYSERCNVLD